MVAINASVCLACSLARMVIINQPSAVGVHSLGKQETENAHDGCNWYSITEWPDHDSAVKPILVCQCAYTTGCPEELRQSVFVAVYKYPDL